MEDYQLKAQVLTEALPWIRSAAGATVVIKYGGAAMIDPDLRASVMGDIALMKLVGVNPVIVHGGGREVSAFMDALAMEVEFKEGQRVTDDDAMDVVMMVLAGKVNKELVSDMNRHGVMAVGISGTDANLITARQRSEDLGRVGDVVSIDTTLIQGLIADGFVPVVATVGVGEDGGSFNINADLVAGELAAALGANKAIFLTDVDGVYRDYANKSTLIHRLDAGEAKELLSSGALAAGMIPKVQACVTALCAGVGRTHILNGTLEHAMLLEVFTDKGIGTMITNGDER